MKSRAAMPPAETHRKAAALRRRPRTAVQYLNESGELAVGLEHLLVMGERGIMAQNEGLVHVL
jgi:hypothetical protein